ncbi:MAG: hypothetical protein M1818_001326 [Claussenomyces sp. TS43310]|nr:MAG: hypothetical protein M1818_001326 [Claussenomyces sp. TS43310]
MSEAPLLRQDVPAVFQSSSANTSRLIHLIPDELAGVVPNHPLFSYPKTSKPQDGFVDVSSKRFANSINRTSWYLATLLGTPHNFDTVGYMGPNDIRYFLFMFAAVKVGYKMLFLSPRNNLEGHLNVLEGVDCQIFLRAQNPNVEQILSKRPMRTSIVPELEDLLDEIPVKVYSYSKTFEEARMDPCLVLHTTGSTGLPKPITWKLGILSTYEAWRTIPPVSGHVPTTEIYQQSKRAYTSMPLFHTSGLNAGITWALLLGVTLVYGAPYVVPNAAYADEMHKYAGVDASMGAPSIYEELSRDSDSLERINRFHYVVASGAPLSQKAGALISKHTRIISNLGATETACLQRLAPGIDDWAYFYWHPTHSGIEMREVMDGLYELFLVRDPKLELYQGVFNTFPDIQEWSMNDLYSRHPDPAKSFLYMYRGRKDDVLVLSNGEKIAPALMEATMMSDPLVKGAMVVGRGRFQPAALIDLAEEPPKGTKQRYQTVQRLLPVIAEANKHAPAHGKLDPYHILFADPKKPIHYLGQGKIQRYHTQELYEKDIEEVYRIADGASEQIGFSRLPRLDFAKEESVTQWLKQLLAEVTGIKGLDMDQDLFEAGLDSLQVIRMARELRLQAKRAGLETAGVKEFPPTVIYAHPTLNQLTEFIFSHSNTKPFGSGHANGYFRNSTAEDMQAILRTYTNSLPHSSQLSPPPSTENMTVILSGSTGSVGSYLLEALYNDKNVSHIICLNRKSNAADKHSQMGPKRGLSPLNTDRVEFLKADFSKAQLGLEASVYERLLSSVTHVIHNQWPVNFNWALSSFEPYIRGVLNLVNFSFASTHKSFLLFVSSVSAVGAWKGQGSAPEEAIYDFGTASNIGYGQSKLISECLLDQAAEISGVRSACCRVSIVAGPVEKRLGMWNRHEYIPSIIISSAYLGTFPATFPSRDRIDWLPVDKLSKILIEILVSSCTVPLEDGRRGTLMYHVVNPNTTSWSTLVPCILASYPPGIDTKAVAFDEWIEVLSQSADDSIDPDRNPAVKLLDFYRGAARVGTGPRMLTSHKAERASATLQHVGRVNEDWVRNWMQQWGIKMG